MAYDQAALETAVKRLRSDLGIHELQIRMQVGHPKVKALLDPRARPWKTEDRPDPRTMASWYKALPSIASTLSWPLPELVRVLEIAVDEPANAVTLPRRRLCEVPSAETYQVKSVILKHHQAISDVYASILRHVIGSMSPKWTISDEVEVESVTRFQDGIRGRAEPFDIGIGVVGSPRREFSGLGLVQIKGLSWSLGAINLSAANTPPQLTWRDIVEMQADSRPNLCVLQDDIGNDFLAGQQQLGRRIYKTIEAGELKAPSDPRLPLEPLAEAIGKLFNEDDTSNYIFVSDAQTCHEVASLLKAPVKSSTLLEPTLQNGFPPSFPLCIGFPYSKANAVLHTRAVDSLYTGVYLTMAQLYVDLGRMSLPGLRLDFFELATAESTDRFWAEFLFQCKRGFTSVEKALDWIPGEAIKRFESDFNPHHIHKDPDYRKKKGKALESVQKKLQFWCDDSVGNA